MGKTTVSSSTFSNVAKSSYKPKLKSTKFQFKSPLQKQKAEKVEQLKGNKHGVSLSSGAYNTTTYAGAGHLYSDQFPKIFWDDREWENGGNF